MANGEKIIDLLSRRNRRFVDQLSQKIIISHARCMHNFWVWVVDDPENRRDYVFDHPLVNFPTFFDHEYLRAVLIKEGIKAFEKLGGGDFIIPVPNTFSPEEGNEYALDKRIFLPLKFDKEKNLWIRYEDSHKDISQIEKTRFLIAKKAIFSSTENLDKRPKTLSDKQFKENLERLYALSPFIKAYIKLVQADYYAEDRANNYEHHLRKSGYTDTVIKESLWSRRYQGIKSSRSTEMTPCQFIIENFFYGKKENYKKAKQKLKKQDLIF